MWEWSINHHPRFWSNRFCDSRLFKLLWCLVIWCWSSKVPSFNLFLLFWKSRWQFSLLFASVCDGRWKNMQWVQWHPAASVALCLGLQVNNGSSILHEFFSEKLVLQNSNEACWLLCQAAFCCACISVVSLAQQVNHQRHKFQSFVSTGLKCWKLTYVVLSC